MISMIVSITKMVTELIQGFANECINHGRTTKIFDTDGLTGFGIYLLDIQSPW